MVCNSFVSSELRLITNRCQNRVSLPCNKLSRAYWHIASTLSACFILSLSQADNCQLTVLSLDRNA